MFLESNLGTGKKESFPGAFFPLMIEFDSTYFSVLTVVLGNILRPITPEEILNLQEHTQNSKENYLEEVEYYSIYKDGWHISVIMTSTESGEEINVFPLFTMPLLDMLHILFKCPYQLQTIKYMISQFFR